MLKTKNLNSLFIFKRQIPTKNISILLICLIGFLAHWPALLSDSIMWDDWIVLNWITEARLDWVFQFYHNYGITPFFLVDFPFVAFIHDPTISIIISKITYFSGILINAVLIMLISLRVSHENLLFATFTGISAVCFPAISGEGFHLTMLIYFFSIPLFLTGILIFIITASSSKPRFYIRIFGLTALLLSFSLNSLLVLFYALIPSVFYTTLQKNHYKSNALLKKILNFLILHIDFLILPVAFWILKEMFMPRIGIYLRYNTMSFDWVGIFTAYQKLIPDIIHTIFFVPISIPFVPLAAVLVFFMVTLYGKFKVKNQKNNFETTQQQFIILFGLGLLALCGAALPYYIVGRRTFQAFGYMSRDNVTFPLPIGWIMASLFCILLNLKTILKMRSAIFGVFAALIVLQSLSSWRNHADWQAHYAFYRSATEKISQDNLVNQASIIHMVDQIPGGRTLINHKYPTSIWTEMVSSAFQKTTRLVLPFSPINDRFFTDDELKKRVQETEINFMLNGINLAGPQIRVTVTPSIHNESPVRLALAYWRARFLVPTDMPKLMNSLTHIKSEKIEKK